MSMISRISLLCALFASSLASAQSTTQEDLGAIPASQAYSGLGWTVNGGHEAEFAAAAAAGATHVRLDACEWSSVEQQSAPPSNVSTGYSLPSGCATALSFAKKYGLQPTVIAAYGAPYHEILTLTLTASVPAGTTSLPVEYSAGIGGSTLSSIAYPNSYLTLATGVRLGERYSYSGTLITGITLTSSTTATIQLASGTFVAQAAGTSLTVNEVLYPSAATSLATDPSVIAYAHYAEYLAKELQAYGLTGEVELWNEPPWGQDCWDNRVDCYDVDPKLPNEMRGNTGNMGFPAALQSTPAISGVTYTWAGTNKSSGLDLLYPGSMLKLSGVSFVDPPTTVTAESFHPYGSNPEDAMWNQGCLLTHLTESQSCNTIPDSGSNAVNAEANNLIAKKTNPTYGIKHAITETGADTDYIAPDHMARFIMRQYLGFMAEDTSLVEFYRLYDSMAEPGTSGFGFMTSVDGGASLTPLAWYTAMSGLISDLETMSLAPVMSYASSSLPAVTSYSGTYNLDHLALVGTRKGDTANSIMYVLYQRSYSANKCGTLPCWGTLASPPGAPTVVSIPSGLKVAQVINLDTREDVIYTQNGSTLQLSVSDDPIEVMLVPATDVTSNLTKPTLIFPTIPAHEQGSSLTVYAISDSPGAISYSVVSGPATISGSIVTLTGTGTVVLSASQAATENYTAAKATTSFSATGIVPDLAFESITSKIFGNTIGVRALSKSPGAITYSVVSGPASIVGNQVTMTGVGTVTLGASQAQSGHYTATTTTISFPVMAEAVTLKFASFGTVTCGTPVTIKGVSPSSGSISYSIVSGPATIVGNVLTPTDQGQVFLQATQAASGGYAAATATTNFIVAARSVALTFGTIPSVTYGDKVTLSATSPSPGLVTYSVTSGAATISGNVLTPTDEGQVYLKATQAAIGGYKVATATINFHVNPKTPNLVITGIPSKGYNVAFPVTTSSPSSGQISWSIVSGPARLSGGAGSPEILTTLSSPGTVVVKASQGVSGGYGTATTTTSFTVAAGAGNTSAPTLVFASIPPQTAGSTVTVKASSASSGAVTYSVVSGPATISGGTVSLTGAGTIVLRAAQAANGKYAAATATATFSVSSATPTLSFANIPSQTAGSTVPVNASSASSGAVTYSVVSGPATISGSTVSLTGAGTVVVHAAQAASGIYAAATASVSFNVSSAVTTLTIASIPPQIAGSVVIVNAKSPSPGGVSYSVFSGPAILSGNVVTVTGAGTVVLQANQAASRPYPAATTTTSFSAVHSTSLTFYGISSQTYGNAPIVVRATSTSSALITYSVLSGPATISGSTVTVTGVGTVVLQASQGASVGNAAATATISFPVVSKTPVLTFGSISPQTPGSVFSVHASSSSDGAIQYSVSSGPASVSGSTVTVLGTTGLVTLQATQAASGNYTNAAAMIVVPVTSNTSTLAFESIPSHNYGDVFAISTTSASTGVITYSVVSGPAKMKGNIVTATGVGTVVLQASQAAHGAYPAATTTTSVIIQASMPALTFTSITPKTFGDVLGVRASSASPGTVSYSVVSGPATISGNQVTMTGAGTVVLGATQAASGGYAAATTTISFPVSPDPKPLTFVSIPSKAVGSTFGVQATSASHGQISYAVEGGAATIKGATVTVTGAGMVTLRADQAANGIYPAASTSISFPVTP